MTSCADGSLCCSNDPQCCQNGRGVFLDEHGRQVSTKPTEPITSYPPRTDGPGRYTLTPSTSTTTITTTSSTSTKDPADGTEPPTTSTPPGAGPTEPSTSNGPGSGGGGSDDSLGLKVGLGLGIPLAVLLTAIVTYFFLRRRLGPRAGDALPPSSYAPDGSQYMQTAASSAPPPHVGLYSATPKPVRHELGDYTPSELDALPPRQTRRHELENNR